MSRPLRQDRPDTPVSLHERAMADLRFIRSTMERSGSFTAVPGWGGVAIGALALPAAWIASQQPTPQRWLAVWMATAVVAALIAGFTLVLKSRRFGVPLASGPGRKFLMSFLPPVGAAVALTVALFPYAPTALLPGVWMLCYGAAVISAGTFSVGAVPLLGIGCMWIGTLALATPAAWGDAWMALGFGGLHLGFGALIARRHGG
jgi:hypothetical protein